MKIMFLIDAKVGYVRQTYMYRIGQDFGCAFVLTFFCEIYAVWKN